jgi:hypothetical protein
MKKFFGLLVISTALFVAGCGNKKRTKAITQQENIVAKEIIATESSCSEDKKEDYSVAA